MLRRHRDFQQQVVPSVSGSPKWNPSLARVADIEHRTVYNDNNDDDIYGYKRVKLTHAGRNGFSYLFPSRPFRENNFRFNNIFISDVRQIISIIGVEVDTLPFVFITLPFCFAITRLLPPKLLPNFWQQSYRGEGLSIKYLTFYNQLTIIRDIVCYYTTGTFLYQQWSKAIHSHQFCTHNSSPWKI